ncbi:MAG: hypothetical protein J2P22_11805 [Nocardioides sp.]|nr:hypothetical protein [Nocardioides sp.]
MRNRPWALPLSIDALEPSITKLAAGDQQTLDKITPLRALGMSSWTEGDAVRLSLKLTTD